MGQSTGLGRAKRGNPEYLVDEAPRLTFSVIVPCEVRSAADAEALRASLDALRACEPPPQEILVVDLASPAAVEIPAGVTLVRVEAPDPVAGRAFAARMAIGDHLVFVAPGIRVPPQSFARLAAERVDPDVVLSTAARRARAYRLLVDRQARRTAPLVPVPSAGFTENLLPLTRFEELVPRRFGAAREEVRARLDDGAGFRAHWDGLDAAQRRRVLSVPLGASVVVALLFRRWRLSAGLAAAFVAWEQELVAALFRAGGFRLVATTLPVLVLERTCEAAGAVAGTADHLAGRLGGRISRRGRLT